jgi:TatA/E family protein of Tat protein translocase
MSTLGFLIPNMGPMELLIIAGLGLLIFGRRLPEVGRSLGKGIVEFRKGLKGIEDDVETEASRPSAAPVQRPLPQPEPAINPPMHAAAAGQAPVDVRVSRADTVD